MAGSGRYSALLDQEEEEGKGEGGREERKESSF